MSRGPGRVERIIGKALAEHPSEVFTLARLATLVYPEVPPKQITYKPFRQNRVVVGIAKRYRSSIRRAAKRAVPRAGWDTMKAEAPGGPPVYYNPCDLDSYARARLLADYGNFHRPDLSNPECLKHPHYAKLLVPQTGAWWWHVEEAKLRRDGNIVAADEIRGRLDKDFEARFGVPRGIG